MKTVVLWTSLGLIICHGMAVAEPMETLGPKCQKLAQEFSVDPASLNETRLKQLQFCITQTLDQRYKTDPPELLKGTIIDAPPTSREDSGTTTPIPSPNPGAKE